MLPSDEDILDFANSLNTHFFYRANLRFLGCTELSDLSKEDQQSHAFHLSLAALLGKGIYNFGELLAHPVLQTLNGTPNEWLINLLGKLLLDHLCQVLK